jgi:phosphotransferase system  glucose/maltose/N-acetylglucosamine-specific IIC component
VSNGDSEKYKPTYRPVVLKNERDRFFVHLVIYIIVNIFLATLNLTSDPDVIWFVYPLIGWGIGIIAHFVFAIVLAKKSEANSEKSPSEDGSDKGKNDEVKSE